MTQRLNRRGGPRLTVEMAGGFANQLFQWGVAETLSAQTGAQVAWDERMVSRPGARGNQLKHIGLTTQVIGPSHLGNIAWEAAASFVPRRAFPHLSHALRPGRFDLVVFDSSSARDHLLRGRDVRLRGYAQEIETLVANRETVRDRLRASVRAFRPDGLPDFYSAMHVRRGDYVSDPLIARKFGPPSIDYYRGARRLLSEPLVIVSDDPGWCREVLAPEVGPALVFDSGSLHGDFVALVGAHELVLSNSTFSWWAAFAGNAGKVVATMPWLDDPAEPDLALEGWLRLDKRTGLPVG